MWPDVTSLTMESTVLLTNAALSLLGLRQGNNMEKQRNRDEALSVSKERTLERGKCPVRNFKSVTWYK